MLALRRCRLDAAVCFCPCLWEGLEYCVCLVFGWWEPKREPASNTFICVDAGSDTHHFALAPTNLCCFDTSGSLEPACWLVCVICSDVLLGTVGR
jgi:hypothetical protein